MYTKNKMIESLNLGIIKLKRFQEGKEGAPIATCMLIAQNMNMYRNAIEKSYFTDEELESTLYPFECVLFYYLSAESQRVSVEIDKLLGSMKDATDLEDKSFEMKKRIDYLVVIADLTAFVATELFGSFKRENKIYKKWRSMLGDMLEEGLPEDEICTCMYEAYENKDPDDNSLDNGCSLNEIVLLEELMKRQYSIFDKYLGRSSSFEDTGITENDSLGSSSLSVMTRDRRKGSISPERKLEVATNLWNMVKAEIKDSLSAVNYETWIEPLSVYRYENKVITLAYKGNNLNLGYLKQRYLLIIKVLMMDKDGEITDVRILASNEDKNKEA